MLLATQYSAIIRRSIPVGFRRALLIGLFICRTGGTDVRAMPLNSNDSFLAGAYGGINRIGMEGDTYSLYTNHGFDWIWLQHKLAVPQILAGHGTETLIRDVGKRSRILLRVLWWGDHNTFSAWQHELNSFGIKPAQYGGENLTGKDWIDLADDPELLEKAKRTIDWQIDVIESRCDKGTLYAVTLSEEEPDVGMSFGRGMAWFAQHEMEVWPQIEKVHNALYDHVKGRYPHLKIATTFYPGALKRAKVRPKLKHDIVCIDPYPAKGQLDETLADCREIYGVSNDVYILLWGCGSLRGVDGFCLKSYREDTEWAETVFRAFREAGYRNIGWFGLNYKTNSFDRITHWIDADSPGTYASNGLAQTVDSANRQWKEALKAISLLPPEVQRNIQIPNALPVVQPKAKPNATIRKNLHYTAERRYALIATSLDAAEETARVLRSLSDLATSQQFLSAYGLVKAVAPVASEKEVQQALANCSAFYRLPEFFRLSQELLGRTRAHTAALLKETGESVSDGKRKRPEASITQAQGALTELRAAWEQLNFTAGAEKAKLLAHAVASAGLSEGVTLRIHLVNPYSYEVNAAPVIRVSDDGNHWTEAYRGEPFHGQARSVIDLPVSIPPAFVMVDNGNWTGAFGVDAVEILRGNDLTCMKVFESRGDVCDLRLAEARNDGFGRIKHVGAGYEKDYIVFSARPSEKS